MQVWPRILTSLSVGSLLLACASNTADSPPATDPQAAAELDVEAMVRREADPIPSQELSSADGLLRATVPARPTKAVGAAENDYYVELDLGSENPIACWFHPGGLALASYLGSVSEALFDESGGLGEVEMRRIANVDAGSIGASPYLGLRWIFRSIQNGQTVVGQLNVLVATKQTLALACVKNELGFDQSFQRVFEELVTSFSYGRTLPRPYYEEISVLEIEQRPAGVQRLSFTLDEEGNTVVAKTVSMALASSPSALTTSDTYDLQLSSESGEVIHQSSWALENGVLTTKLSLARETAESWRVSGNVRQEEIDVTIDASDLASTLAQMQALRAALEGHGTEVNLPLPVWIAGADPTRLFTTRAEILERLPADEFRVRLETGPTILDGIVDNEASFGTGELQSGPTSLRVRRVHRRGDF